MEKLEEVIGLEQYNRLNKGIQNLLNIKTENTDNEFNQIKIVDLSGRLILVGKFDNNNTKIDVSYFHSGIYELQISNSKGSFRQLFIKE